MGIKVKESPKKYKKTRYAIINVSMKDLSKIIREFEKLRYKSYNRRRPKHDPTDSYFYLAPCKNRNDWCEKNPILHVCSKDDIKLKEFLTDEIVSHVCSTDEGESESIIADESYTEEIKSDFFTKS